MRSNKHNIQTYYRTRLFGNRMIIGKNIVRNDTVFSYRSIKKRGGKTRYKKNVDSLHGIG